MAVFNINTNIVVPHPVRGESQLHFAFDCAHMTVDDLMADLKENGYVVGDKLFFDRGGIEERVIRQRVRMALLPAGLTAVAQWTGSRVVEYA